ncbi:hypothetical protein DL89DRAFT_252038 [Linderina pennispora]|uniref:E3 ubiquitin-protein ligase n=1 Tax=Linderina pennispora TaxID=61395 RepID=A0A1Y1VT70_9FUNG|nr:uncharacterized protein DL89DRAFT_252038 [Linderina pennispora]ORX64383.1 hypothetical protein DL89DRAFT_252038 [Linderina pennispora]
MNSGTPAEPMTASIPAGAAATAADPAASHTPSESFIDEPYSVELYDYLRNTPKRYNYMLTPAARKDILHKVSWYLLSKDDRLADLVPLDERTGGAPREELQDEFETPIEYTEVRRGQPCGHVFKRGEGVYRCKNCAMDDTCVLCTRCFQATDHTGHDTSFSVNSGTGGCCDCGDPEAWKIPLRCRHHSSFEELDEIGFDPIISSAGAPFVPGYNNHNECPVSVRRAIELTIAVVLEFILETFSTSPVHLRTSFDERSIIEDAQSASEALGDPEVQTKFAIVLWNDEVHSFQDVIDQCTQALDCSPVEARKIAETVDVSGRDVLRVSTSITDLIEIATSMVNVSLCISIRAARDVFREQLSASLLIWLRDLACCKFRPLARVFQGKVNNEIRSEISHQLCLHRAYDHATSHAIRRVLRGCGQQRLDWFLIFDLQLWKEVRSGLRELYMATLMLDGRYKMKIALTFSRNYPRLSRAFLTQDRAPEHSVLLFSVQLFTAPTLSAELVDHHRFLYIILSVLKRFFVEPTPEFLRHQGVVLCDTESFRNRRYFHVFHDMRYLAGTPQVRNWVSSQHQFLATYVGFIGLFQGMNPNRRAVLQHVEFEADTWVNAFNVTLQVAKSCRQFAECYGISARDLFFAMRGTLRALRHSVALMAEENCGNLGDAMPLVAEAHIRSTMWGSQYYIVKYDVASCPVSFHHPLHWFMAELCQHVKLLSEDIAREYGFDSIRHMIFTAFNRAQHELLRILDYPIRVCVVMAQIRAGLWVRNGYVIRSQSHHYREVSLRENTYDQDIVMIQFFLSIWPDTDHILMALLDRFGLYDWFSGQPHVSEVYEQSHLQYMVEEFLNVLIVLVSERHVATGKNALDLARREIVHGCLSPIAYSELSKKIPERLAEHTEFDNLLQEMAEYRSPVSIMDFGMYELKDEYLDEVDPYFIHYSRNQREEVEELLHERLKKRLRRSGGDPDAVPAYIPPKLDPIRFGPFQRLGMVLHTPLACQVLFNALYHATNTPNHYMSETMVDEALQLVVLALEDGRRGAQGYPMSKGGKPMNFLALVLSLGLRSELKQWKPKLDYILKLFREGGPRVISCIDEYYASLESTPLGSHVLRTAQDEASAAERKKQEAKARQAAILADFANRQQNFMAQFGDEFDDLTDEEDIDKADDVVETSADKGKGSDMSRVHNSLWTTPGGTCIVCQEECDGTKPYGILSLVQASRVARTAPLSDVISVTDILGMPGGLDCEINDAPAIAPQTPESSMSASKITYGAPSGLKGFPVLYHERGMVANTCGHLMHLRCFTQYYQGIEAKRQNQPTRNHPENPHRKEYLCPLCKSLGNILLPVLPHVGDYDPLTITDQNPERFAIAPVLSGGPGSQAESSSGSDREGTSQARTPSSSTPAIGAAAAAAPGGSTPEAPAGFRAMGQTAEDTLASGLIASLRNAGGFSFNLPEGLTESLPRNLDLLRAAQHLPGGFAADSRSQPSGTLVDGVPEAHAVFMHSLAKIAEMHYRTAFGPVSDLATGTASTDSPALTPAQKLRWLMSQSSPLPSPSPSPAHTPGAATAQREAMQQTRMSMLKDLSYILGPLTGIPVLLSSISGGTDAKVVEASAPGINSLILWVIRQIRGSDMDEEVLTRFRYSAHRTTVTKLVVSLMLPFLRRLALTLYLQYGIDLAREAPWMREERARAATNNDPQIMAQSEPECVRLLKILNLPELHKVFVPEAQPGMTAIVSNWLKDLRVFRSRHGSAVSLGAGYTMAVPVSMPTPYTLVEMPDRFEVLFERSAKAFCPRCNSVPSDPALCLLCGSFVCSQSFCCEVQGIGECNMHMKSCGGTVGVYLLVKKCGLLLLHHDNGCFMSAPYLDQHGEVDLGLKRGRPLFINQNRYDEMRKLVLTQKIPVFVARKIDQAFDIGGWVSL